MMSKVSEEKKYIGKIYIKSMYLVHTDLKTMAWDAVTEIDSDQQSYDFLKHIGHSKELIFHSWCIRKKVIKVRLPDKMQS